MCHSQTPSRDSRCLSSSSFFISPYSYTIVILLTVEESSSTTVAAPPRRPTVLNETNTSPNLIVLNVNAQTPLKLITTKYFAWRLQFTSLLFQYDLLSFVNSSKPCPLAMITMLDNASPSPNLDHILWLRQDQLLLNAIIGSVSTTLVQFLSTSTTSLVAWTTLE